MKPITALTLLILASAAQAQSRYLVQYTCPGYVPDSRRAASNVAGTSTVTPPGTPVTPALPTVPAPAITISTNLEPSKAKVDLPPTPIAVTADADESIQLATTEPTAAFRARMADPYHLSVEDDVVAAWRWYEREPAALADEVRTGNAVIRMVQALGRAPTGGSLARPLLDDSKKTATRARLRGGAVVIGRKAPWGAHSSANYTGGAAVDLAPPANGVWFHVKGGAKDEWICGLWLDF